MSPKLVIAYDVPTTARRDSGLSSPPLYICLWHFDCAHNFELATFPPSDYVRRPSVKQATSVHGALTVKEWRELAAAPKHFINMVNLSPCVPKD